MASIFRKARSPYWFIQTIRDGKRCNQSTKLRADNRIETAQARALCAAKTAHVLEHKERTESGGWGFVDPFLKDHCKNEKTARAYRLRWEWLQLFFSSHGITNPNVIKFSHIDEYITWRTLPKKLPISITPTSRTNRKKRLKKTVSRNSAIYDIKLLSMLLDRAVRLGLCASNVLLRPGLKKDRAKEKPEITAAQFAVILPALEQEAEWMKTAFLIGMHTGCRLGETRLPMKALDFKRQTITFDTPKGGADRAFSAPMPRALIPFLRSLQDGRKYTLEFPVQPSRQWQHFFRRLGFTGLCFHCLRVSFVTRLARKSVSQPLVMRLVNHSSTLVHQIYQRLSVDDVRGVSLDLFSDVGPAANGDSRPGK